MKISSHWLCLFFGKPRQSLEIKEAGLRVTAKDLQQDFPYETVKALATEPGRAFASLRLETADGATSVAWLRPRDATCAVATATVWRCATAAQDAVFSFEELLAQDAYLNRRQLEAWRHLHWSGCEPLLHLSLDDAVLPTDSAAMAVACRYVELATNLDETVRSRNDAFTSDEARRYMRFFSRVEKNPHTDRQIEAIVSDEDNTLVVAGAGTGKTSTVVGKVGYLMERRIASED